MRSLFPPLSEEARKTLASVPALVEKTFPIPARIRSALPSDVAELFSLLTSRRTERGASYLGKPALLSAYLRYYMPWNIYRLCRLLAALPIELKSDDAINDLGAGPLTLAASLWISRPDLRQIPLEIRCLDKTAAVLEAGKKFFAALAPACPWTVKTIRGEIRASGRQRGGTLSVEIRGKPAALSAAVNVYNELFWDFSPMDKEGLERFAQSQARLLSSLTESPGQILVVEPGIPRSGEFISLLRSLLIKEKRLPFSPCPHSGACPLPGSRPTSGHLQHKTKWCHFALNTEDAPEDLHRLSAVLKLPKERAALSFILAGATAQNQAKRTERTWRTERVKVRVISDSFPISADSPGTRDRENNTWGRYGCSERALVLVTGSRRTLESSPPGTLEELVLEDGRIDAKSGALIGNIL
jgi:hypothetical protein